ncbi:MAG TPA: protease inhibitor I42 family protein [Syntrophomonadaceae bacterium]|nr:protease inhibitor I42 family protein [Syntrophomonadaceae bacterium]
MIRRLPVLVLTGFLVFSFSWAVMADQGSNFADIQGHWGEQVILDIASRGLMQGIGNNEVGQRLFAPEMLVDRAQTASVLVAVFTLDYGSKRFIKQPLPNSYYQDVDNQAWYANAAMLCAINEIFPASDHFNPEQPISRLEMAQAIQRCFYAKGIEITMNKSMPVFNDVSALSTTELNSIAFVNNTGIMQGDDQKFRPADSLNRAELAQILENCLNILQSQSVIGENYDGKEYTTSPGQTFTLALPSNPTTGSQWTLSDNYDHGVISLSNSYYKSPPQSDPPIVGQGGTEYWVFKALQAGTIELKLTYGQPWAPTPPFKTFTVKITVSADTAPAAL